MDEKWQKAHRNTIDDFLSYLNKRTNNYVLKGGTSLMKFYQLDRFSEDIDFDSTDKNNIKRIIPQYCKERGFTYRLAKDTDTVKRFYINYGNDNKPLKIETSYRQKQIKKDRVRIINGIAVYDINHIALLKSTAYSGRNKLRDLYDLTFICNNHWDNLTDSTKDIIQNAFESKGLEYFDYITSNQNDPLIDKDKLANDFIDAFDKLGLVTDNPANISHTQDTVLKEQTTTQDRVQMIRSEFGDIDEQYEQLHSIESASLLKKPGE